MRGTATSFGYWVRRRRLALDLTQDALARRVGCSSAAIKKIERDERRPSRTMATRLAEALGLAADERPRFVAAGVGELAPDRLGPVDAPPGARPDAGPVPAWLTPPVRTGPRLVGRDRELATLRSHLDAALAGHGRTVFVTGEAGQGKTALLTAFVEAAQRAVPELVVAHGAGTATGGYGDPYLPVRDVFRMLVADPHASWRPHRLTAEQAERLWRFAPDAARVVRATGPHLLDVLVPAGTVQQRLGSGRVVTGAADHATRDHVVAEVTDVLRELAGHRPLLVLLDDMQWADTASAELLFHLSRRLAGARVLVVCAYRASEVAEASGPAVGAVRRALLETRRDLDDAQIDLDHLPSDAERALFDALLELEVPAPDPELRDALYQRTRGHPLFVQELVRELKARGDLARGADGSWAARAGLDWSHVPARVAAVIGQRLDRLGPAERTLLDAAAIEGEHFTAEPAARAAGLDDRAAYRLLRQLDRTHALVREAGTIRVGGQVLTGYRFGHALFQQYVYDALGEGARRRGHGELAAELEALHAADLEPVVARLAHHYAESGDAQRAVPYLIRAGDRARLLHAHDEATAAYERAAQLLRAAGDRERLARTVMKIGLTHQTRFDHDRAQAAFDEAFALWSAVDRAGARPVGSATLRLVWQEPHTLDPTLGGYTIPAPVVTNLLSGLVRYDEDTNVVPDVAARWEISDGGRRYVFHLRDDVTWSDGRPVTAHDFVFTYRRALDPATGAAIAPAVLDAVTHARAVRAGRAPPERAGIHAVDDRTLVIELAEPTSYFIYNLAYYVLLPVPRHAVEAHGAGWCRPETMVSNGPFRLAEWEPGRTMVLERNAGYHGPTRGNVYRVVLDLAVPEAELEARYLADEIDLLSVGWFCPAAVLDRLRRRLPSEHARREAFVSRYYWTSVNAFPLSDRRVRRAMAMAVDRGALAMGWRHGLAEPATGGLVPPGMPGHTAGLAAPYDPAQAARLVAEVAGGRPLPEITIIAHELYEIAAREICAGWRAVGLPVRVRSFPAADIVAVWAGTPEPKVAMGGWIADYPDPDTFLRVSVEFGLPDWRHAPYHSLLERAARATDPAVRLARYGDAERVLAGEAVVVPLLYESEHLMLKPWVSSYPTIPVKSPGFWEDVVIGPR